MGAKEVQCCVSTAGMGQTIIGHSKTTLPKNNARLYRLVPKRRSSTFKTLTSRPGALTRGNWQFNPARAYRWRCAIQRQADPFVAGVSVGSVANRNFTHTRPPLTVVGLHAHDEPGSLNSRGTLVYSQVHMAMHSFFLTDF